MITIQIVVFLLVSFLWRGYESCTDTQCGPNEIMKPCGGICEDSCQFHFETFRPLCAIYCPENTTDYSCGCADGFIRDGANRCVKPEECPGYPNVCGPNEILKYCGKLCGATCNGLQPCIYSCTEDKTCGCVDGYYLNSNNNCVEQCQCPPANQTEICPVNQYSSPGGRACEATCSNPNPQQCTDVMYEDSCTCLPGYLRDSFNNCVLPRNCPAQNCPPNEYNSTCGPVCEPTCDNPNPKVCPEYCKLGGGCTCMKGFVRNKAGDCVNLNECPNTECGVNESLQPCGGGPCEPTCSSYFANNTCLAKCRPDILSCGCNSSLVRNSNGNCIDPSYCPPNGTDEKCPVNEYFDECGGYCEPTCEAPGPRICYTLLCRPGDGACTCLPGYIRASNGNCVVPSACPKPTCPINERYATCGPVCEPTCDNPYPKVCPYICLANGGCTCKDGFVRNDNGDCVLLNECPNVECGVNELLQPGGGGPCEPTCFSYYTNTTCISDCNPNELTCGCNSSFVRNSNRNCIDPSYCPPNGTDEKCPVNEHFVECGGCEPTCDDPETHICFLPLCRPGEGKCICLPGYLRDSSNGGCVTPSNCPVPPPPTCDVNEVAKPCGGVCEPTCANYKNPPKCLYLCPNKTLTCGCDDGLVRNSNGNCVDPSMCPPEGELETCPVNEYNKSCGRVCERTCSNPDPQVCSYACSAYGGCSCLPGYLRSASGCCVQPYECSKECGPNAEYTTCGSSCAPTCSPEIRFCPAVCVEGCFCKSGYVSSKNGCILRENCPPEETCYSNQIYNSCGTSCPLTCRNYLNPPKFCNKRCNPGCFCKDDGYVLTDQGTCVLPENCPGNEICPFDHMVYSECGTACPLTCKNIDNPPDVCIDLCVKGCFCEEGYVQADDGSCVKPEECKNMLCGPNQEYQSCGSSCPDTCDNYLNTNRICTLQCVSGCFCKKGYVNDTSTGQCIPPGECPCPPTCGQNEVFQECGTACPDTCDNYFLPNRPCTYQCVRGCFCQKGYVRDTSNGMCVRRSQCPPPMQCGVNEQYTDCGNGCRELCDKTTVRCDNNCYTGCFCKPGYLRDKKGRCVLENQCPNNQNCGIHEVYTTCGNRCSELCDSSAVDCSSQCVVGCFCQEGYFRDQLGGGCIPANECPNRQLCGPNESYVTCGDRCAEKCVSSGIDCSNCEDGCFCNLGYRRDSEGNCVPENECSNQQCGFNEMYSDCGNYCDDLCNNTGIACVASCQKGCFCQKGYKRGYHGSCIPRCECKNEKCGINEEYNACGNSCSERCDRAYILCLAGCSPGCYCKNGFLRDPNGYCVPENECPNMQQCGVNEVYLIDGPPYDTFCQSNGQYESPPIIGQNSGCFCIDGYARDENYICIPADQCPHNCGNNEVFKTCGSLCPDTCDNLGTLRSCIAQCVVGCFCQDGYVRNGSGCCVLPEQCPLRECSGPNEVYTDCLSNCPLTCRNLPYPNNRCNNQIQPQYCRKGCECDVGYARDDNGYCIPTKDCKITCRTVFEVYSCGSACDTECAHLGETCPIVNIKCNDMCYCIDGYARNSNWECVPIENCDNPNPVC